MSISYIWTMDQFLETSSKALLPIKEGELNLPKISIIGSSLRIDSIRKYLEYMDLESIQNELSDLGNLRPESKENWSDYLCELIESKEYIPLCISDSRYIKDLLSSFQQLEDYKCSIISNRVSDIGRTSRAAQYDCYVGTQSHYKQDVDIADDNVIRLTDVRYNHDRAEVLLRNTDIAYIDISAIRYSDNIGHNGSGPAGMTIEEACQIARYIGASMHLKGVIIGTYDENSDANGITAHNIALLTYYLTQGYQLRKSESNVSSNKKSEFNTYTVIPDELDNVLTFVENNVSGRWWLKLEDEDGKENLIPCSKEDYQKACCNIITDKIAEIFTLI